MNLDTEIVEEERSEDQSTSSTTTSTTSTSKTKCSSSTSTSTKKKTRRCFTTSSNIRRTFQKIKQNNKLILILIDCVNKKSCFFTKLNQQRDRILNRDI